MLNSIYKSMDKLIKIQGGRCQVENKNLSHIEFFRLIRDVANINYGFKSIKAIKKTLIFYLWPIKISKKYAIFSRQQLNKGAISFRLFLNTMTHCDNRTW